MHLTNRSKRAVCAIQLMLLAAGLSISGNSIAALDAFLTLEGETQGAITGDVTQAGREGSIRVIGYSHKNGEGDKWQDCKVGESSHEPLVIIKENERSTPQLYQAYASGESFTNFALRFWRPSPSGQEEQYFTIELINAKIIGIDQQMLNNRIPENMPLRVMEHVSFVYDAIVRTYEDGGITAVDEFKTNCGK